MSYIGNSPGVASQRVTTTLTATAAQTQFTTQSGYVLGYVDVYLNGAKLVNGADFEAITGTYITLFAGAAAGDVVELISYVPRGLSDGYTKAEADSKFLDVGGDTATGTMNLAVNSLVVGTTQLVTSGTNNVGINTASPKTNGATFGTLTLNGSNGGAIQFTTADVNIAQIYNDGNALFINPSTGKTLSLQVAGSTIASVSSTGIGITGTASVSGNLTLSGGTANSVPYLNGSKVVTTGSALTFDGSNLGVGSASYGNAGAINVSVGAPASTIGGLQLWSTTTGNHYVQFGDGTTGTDPYRGAIGYNHTADNLVFYSAGAIGLTLTSSYLYTGSSISVGIGTSNPTAQLEIGRTSTSGYSTLRLSNSGASGRTYEIGLGGNTAAAGYANNLYFYDSTAAVNRMVLTSAGNLGVGTGTADARLQVGSTSDVVIAMSNSSSVTSGNRGSIAMFNSANSTVGIIRFGATIDNVGTNIQFSTRPAGGALVESMYLGAGINSSNNAMLTINTIATATRQNLAAIDKTTTNWVRFTNPQYSADASMGLILRSFPNSDARQGAGIIASGGATNNSTDLSLFITNSDATSFAAYTATANGGSVDHTWNKAPNSGAMTLDANGVAYIGGTSGTATRLNLIKDTNSTVEQLLFLRNSGTGYKGTQIAFGEYTTTQGYITNHYVSTGGPIWCTDIGGTDVVRFFTGSSPGTERGRFNSTGLNVTGAITENNVAIVTQSDVGTAPNEIPLNQYLGNMAYQDSANYYNTGMTAGYRNRIINGAMAIAQRGYATTSNPGLGYASIGTLDRWGFWCSSNAAFTTAQVSDAPTGFVYSTLITSSGSIALGGNTYGTFSQRIEGNNIADLAWGTANAKPITISFWVKSSLTGTFSAYVFNDNYSYCFPFTFSIQTANTWVQITQTIAGPTTGLWQTDTRTGLEFGITLLNGTSYSSTTNASWITANYIIGSPTSVNLLSTSGATMNVTGVQFERGSVATPFDVRPYGTELALCQRYYFVSQSKRNLATVFNSTDMQAPTISFPVSMRTNPTGVGITAPNITGSGNWGIYGATNGWGSSAGYTPVFTTTIDGSAVAFSSVGGVSNGSSYLIEGGVKFSAEL